jgi:hypothetical protein
MGWHVARMEETRNAYRILMEQKRKDQRKQERNKEEKAKIWKMEEIGIC